MKNLIKSLMIVTLVLLSTTINAQKIKNAKTEDVKIHGNCGMCESKIEKAGNLKNVASVDWNQETSRATLTYDAKKTNKDEILKRIALVGYDSESFLAPDEVYNNLQGCCQYDRAAKTQFEEVQAEIQEEVILEDHSNHSGMEMTLKANQLQPVFDTYFAVKDAMVNTDGKMASASAKELVAAIYAVKMGELDHNVHMVWMKVVKTLNADASSIAASTDAKTQRDSFDTLSTSMYELIKAAKFSETVYYQHCPMANDGKGATWLSKEEAVKNPYYGSTMMSCGKTVETIK